MTTIMKKTFEFLILGTPVPKQSARFRVQKFGNKTAVVSYQSKKVKKAEQNTAFDVKSQLPDSFELLDCPLEANVVFVFHPPKGWPKYKKEALRNGNIFYKETRPDLTDNLMKGLFDAMQGIVFSDDSRIVKVSSMKIYGYQPMTSVTIKEL